MLKNALSVSKTIVSTPTVPSPTSPGNGPANREREWAPRIWEGADYFAWLRLLFSNRCAVEAPYAYIATIVSCSTFVNTVLRWVQHGLYGQKIDQTRIQQPPLFVLGHWRTGTTLLHELLILDERHSSPDTYDCFCPGHLLISEQFYKKQLAFLMPGKRPMDNMPAGWERPQEDEFALCLLGQPSTYSDIAFPNRPSLNPGALDLSGLSPAQLRSWKRTFYSLVQALTLKDPRRLVLKSPPHTARVPVLLDLFPDARFVHIVRDPYVLFASTCNLWLTLGRKHGFQTPRPGPELEEKVFREFRILHERYEQARTLIPPGNLIELRYETFVKDIVAGTQSIYEKLNLDGWERIRQRVEAYAARSKNYETNRYQITDEMRARIRERWGDIIERLGY